MKSDELRSLLHPLIYREIASIGAIDTAMPLEDDPGYVVLFRAAKLGKQANVEQMSALLRSLGEQPPVSALALESVLKMQTALAERLGTTAALRAMRFVQEELTAAYERAYERLDGLAEKCVEKCWHRAIKQWTILDAHIAKRGMLDLEEKLRLPLTLDRYFAHEEARACMRCHFDRPGELGPIERTDPHPQQYVCAACHDEVMRDFPPDLIDQVHALPEYDRESLVVEKALGRPSTLRAEKEVLAKLSGLAPDMPPPPMARKSAAFTGTEISLPPPPPLKLDIHADAGSLDERLYVELLFDWRAVRHNW